MWLRINLKSYVRHRQLTGAKKRPVRETKLAGTFRTAPLSNERCPINPDLSWTCPGSSMSNSCASRERGSASALRLIVRRHNQRLDRVARAIVRDDTKPLDHWTRRSSGRFPMERTQRLALVGLVIVTVAGAKLASAQTSGKAFD